MQASGLLSEKETAAEPLDVIIVGAGISGIGGAHYLKRHCPDQRFVMLEAEATYGGTWLTNRFPGARTDSDMFTFSYSFKPWQEASVATAGEIRAYMAEVLEEDDLESHIRYRHRIRTASWCSESNLWTLEVAAGEAGELRTLRCRFLWMCQGYYRHREGYTPSWPGMDSFRGTLAHPQNWPDGLDYRDKKVVVVGSGATAATVVPAMAEQARHVTMLQRTPTFFYPRPTDDQLGVELKRRGVSAEYYHRAMRRLYFERQAELDREARERPEALRQQLLEAVRACLPPEYDVERTFNPPYRPWQQRLAVVPDGDLFKAMGAGKVSVVTDEIERFTHSGVGLKSGHELDADIVVTATGFNISMLGDIDFHIDGQRLDPSRTVTYRGMMFTGVPNLAWVFGYYRYSWTPRAELVGQFLCRLLTHMDEIDAQRVVPGLRDEDRDMRFGSWVETDFNPGYLARCAHLFPQQGERAPWRHSQDYPQDRIDFPAIELDDPLFRYA